MSSHHVKGELLLKVGIMIKKLNKIGRLHLSLHKSKQKQAIYS